MKATTKINRTEDGEYRVRLFIDGEYQSGADYYTDDRGDAKRTAWEMEMKAVPSDKTSEVAKEEQAEYEADTLFSKGESEDEQEEATRPIPNVFERLQAEAVILDAQSYLWFAGLITLQKSVATCAMHWELLYSLGIVATNEEYPNKAKELWEVMKRVQYRTDKPEWFDEMATAVCACF